MSIAAEAERSNNRKAYKGVCALINTLRRAGGKDEALQLIVSLLAKYGRRPAFVEELTMISKR